MTGERRVFLVNSVTPIRLDDVTTLVSASLNPSGSVVIYNYDSEVTLEELEMNLEGLEIKAFFQENMMDSLCADAALKHEGISIEARYSFQGGGNVSVAVTQDDCL